MLRNVPPLTVQIPVQNMKKDSCPTPIPTPPPNDFTLTRGALQRLESQRSLRRPEDRQRPEYEQSDVQVRQRPEYEQSDVQVRQRPPSSINSEKRPPPSEAGSEFSCEIVEQHDCLY